MKPSGNLHLKICVRKKQKEANSVHINLKFNFVPNCWDGGDEENCKISSEKDMVSYKSDTPDIGIYDAGNIIKKPVNISLTITNIESIDELKSKFTAFFILHSI